MNMKNKKYYIIREDVLPEAVQKTIIIKNELEKNPKLSIQEVSKKYGLSRSAFYKYKDTIYPLKDFKKESILSLSIHVDDIPGILGKILKIIHCENGNIITIHQTVPINERATIIISLNINLEITDIEKIKHLLSNLKHVNKVKVIGVSI
ncbi:ACT domain protein [Gemelliphila asaccharolytica]|uniref:ACT domain protein n=2 Tax=Gemelliphila asaccharolytica TaxID=502393 RepID=A0ABR5TL84_9BACL|nr:ACT domain protein [Gemella asaccharolytica]